MIAVGLGHRQVIRAFPQGGGSYIVASENLGPLAGLLAGAGLILDYTLTVTVSIAAGVAAVTSAVPSLSTAGRRGGCPRPRSRSPRSQSERSRIPVWGDRDDWNRGDFKLAARRLCALLAAARLAPMGSAWSVLATFRLASRRERCSSSHRRACSRRDDAVYRQQRGRRARSWARLSVTIRA